jgi:zinc/manganese transport system substrate-binding protein
MKKKIVIAAIVLVLVVLVGIGIKDSHNQNTNDSKIQVVAAENFWGSLVSQIGGNKVHVLSIVSDPNADPHEYESNSADARSVSEANYVITNGAGYDSWADKLLAASPNPKRQVLNVATLLGKKDGDNPHFWYSPSYVNRVTAQMTNNLISLDPKDASYYRANLALLKTKLSVYQDQINDIAQQFQGQKVAATEDIFAYLASATKLDLISPPDFIQAVAEGNDPPANSVATFQQQLTSGQVKLLVYNEQTVTPITTTMKRIAAEQNIPVVGVTETIQPPNASFEDWMNSEIISIENGLNATKLGQ